MARGSKEERELAAARRRAAKRRKVFEEQVLSPSSNYVQPQPKTTLKARIENMPPLQAAATGLLASIVCCATILWGAPLLGQPARPVVLGVGGLAVAVLSFAVAGTCRKFSTRNRFLVVVASVLLPVLLTLGLSSQVVVDGRAYLRNSVTAKSYEMGEAVLVDLRVLEENAKLLSLEPAQAAGLGDIIVGAREQAADIAERWNPAVAAEAPLPGFAEVMRLTNASAVAQVRALEAYEANLIVQDPARSAEVYELATTSREFYVEAAEELARTLRPLGIDLTTGVEPQ